VLQEPGNHGILRFPLGADHAERVPQGDGAVAEAPGEEAEGEGVALDRARAGPAEAVEAVGGRGSGQELQVGGVGLEVEAEDLDVGRRGELLVDGTPHGAGGEVGRLRRERRQRRPLRALDARHLRRPAHQIWVPRSLAGLPRRALAAGTGALQWKIFRDLDWRRGV